MYPNTSQYHSRITRTQPHKGSNTYVSLRHTLAFSQNLVGEVLSGDLQKSHTLVIKFGHKAMQFFKTGHDANGNILFLREGSKTGKSWKIRPITDQVDHITRENQSIFVETSPSS